VHNRLITATLEQARAEGLRFLPQSLEEALDAFEADEVVQGALGLPLAAEFLSMKRREWVRYHKAVGQWEVDEYLTLF
jgi:glutamine synthetase